MQPGKYSLSTDLCNVVTGSTGRFANATASGVFDSQSTVSRQSALDSVAASGASREALVMKMKIFHSADWGILEQTISEWLKNERINRLVCVTHTNHEATMFITVWWK